LSDEESVLRGQVLDIMSVVSACASLSLSRGKSVLEGLLGSGEIKRLDAEIGRRARGGELDAGFFWVLGVNIEDAGREEGGGKGGDHTNGDHTNGDHTNGDTIVSPPEDMTVSPLVSPPSGTTRLQILQHIYTRCQEELEKSISSPSQQLLMKLLRTAQPDIRRNLLEHYLIGGRNVVVNPDGREIDLSPSSSSSSSLPPKVSLVDFLASLSELVAEVRGMNAGGQIDDTAKANLVESARQVGIQLRGVVREGYGEGGKEVRMVEEILQPVFRPVE